MYLIINCCLTISAQKLESAFRHAGYGQLENVGMFKDNLGNNVIIGGYASANIDVDPSTATVTLPPPNNFGFYILKYDINGNYLGGFGIAGASANQELIISDAATDVAGNFYVVGRFKGIIDFDPSPASFTVSNNSPTSGHGFIAKYDASLNLQWVHRFNNTNYSNFQNVKVDPTGKIYLSGYFWGTEDLDFGSGVTNVNSSSPGGNFVAVYTNSMNLIYHMVNVGKFNSLIEVDPSGNVYTAGNFNTLTDFDPTVSTFTLQSSGSDDVYLAKYSPSLTLLWAGKVGNSNFDVVTHIKIDNNNDLIYAGQYSGTVDFDPGIGSSILTTSGNEKFLLKLNNSGNFNWVKTFSVTLPSGNMTSDAISVDQFNNIYFTGSFTGTQEFNPGSSSFTMQASGDSDAFLEKFNSAGNFQWAFRFGGPSSAFNYTQGHCTFIENSGTINMVGSMRAVTDFDPSVYESHGITGFTAFYSGYISRYNQLTTGNVAPLYACSNTTTSVVVPFNFDGTANVGNVFNAQLSDAAGNFTSAITIGTLSALSSSSINAVVPSTLSLSGNYKIRVISSNPPLIGERSQVTFSVISSPTILALSSSSTICIGQSATLSASGALSYTWFPLGSSSVTVVSPTISTTYTIEGTAANGCIGKTILTQSVSTCTMREEIKNSLNNIIIYPNPVVNELNIQTTNSAINNKVQIMNAIGSIVYSGKIDKENVLINSTDFESGIYFLQIINSTDVQTFKFIKQ
jgi:hypothetical protein